MPEAIFDGYCQIFPDEKEELDILALEQATLTTPKENTGKNKIELI